MITRRESFALCLALAAGGLSAGARARPRPSTNPDFRSVIARAAPAIVAVGTADRTLGSGFVLAASGATVPKARIATAAHVVAAAGGATLTATIDGVRQDAAVVALDRDADVALLEVASAGGVQGLPLLAAEERHEVGEWIVVLGNPFGTGITATIGIISALPGAIASNDTLKNRIQVNAAVNPGNSGGPVLNLRGEVIGIANATIPGGFGLGFAIPAEALRALLSPTARRP